MVINYLQSYLYHKTIFLCIWKVVFGFDHFCNAVCINNVFRHVFILKYLQLHYNCTIVSYFHFRWTTCKALCFYNVFERTFFNYNIVIFATVSNLYHIVIFLTYLMMRFCNAGWFDYIFLNLVKYLNKNVLYLRNTCSSVRWGTV